MKYSDILPMYIASFYEPLVSKCKISKSGSRYKKVVIYDKFYKKIISGDDSVTCDHSLKLTIFSISERIQGSVEANPISINIEENNDNYFVDDIPGMVSGNDA